MAKGHYSVHPKYSSGSGAMVDKRTAMRVAQDEREGYTRSLSGTYGPEKQAQAKKEGLSGIVELLKETRKGWEVHDILTDEIFIRPFEIPETA